ncbi:unnamed protein product [Arctogadus glacialis]
MKKIHGDQHQTKPGHLTSFAVILVEKMNAVGWRPILLLEYPDKEAKMLLPEGLISSVGERKCLDNIKEMYSLIVEGKKVPSDTATEMPQGQGEAIYILNFESEDPMQIQETLLSATPTTTTNGQSCVQPVLNLRQVTQKTSMIGP